MPKLTADLAATITADFEQLLAACGGEEEMHRFLSAHSVQLLRILRIQGIVRSKFRLAEQFVPDFLLVGLQSYSNCPRPMVAFIEIERVDMPLFTKNGDPTSQLTHAIRQVTDWREWVQNNRPYLKATLQKTLAESELRDCEDYLRYDRRFDLIADGVSDRYFVFAGRRHSMSLSARLRLAQMNEAFTYYLRVMTYDALWEELVAGIGEHSYFPRD
jgi:Domain of unknown function (DUF4263)